jgi:glycosyltransferase involved in cell wall biosynthesis
MRILQISPSDLGGGAECVAWQLFQAFRWRGHESYLAVGLKQSADPGVITIPNHECRSSWAKAWTAVGDLLSPFVGEIRGAGRLRRLVTLGIGEPRRWHAIHKGMEDFEFPGTRRVLSLIPEEPHIVNCHNLHAPWLLDGGYFDLRVLPELSWRVPLVLTLHDAWLMSGHCAYSFGCERWRTGCGACPDLTIYPAVNKDETAYNWARKQKLLASSRLFVTAPSEWLMAQVGGSLLAAGMRKHRVIPNGVDVARFRPADKREARDAVGLPQGSQVVLFAATHARKNLWKDLETARRAMGLVGQALAERDIVFVILGDDGPPERLGRMTALFVPYQKDPDAVARYYQAADIYLHASHFESWGLTVTEALACGTPVVATGVGGILEQVEERIGFLVPRGDAAAMADRVIRLLRDDALRTWMGTEAARIVRERFSQDDQVTRYLEWYEEILDWCRADRTAATGQGAALEKRVT